MYRHGPNFIITILDPLSLQQAIPICMSRFIWMNKLESSTVSLKFDETHSWSVVIKLIKDVFYFTDGWCEVLNYFGHESFFMIFNYLGDHTFKFNLFSHDPNKEFGKSFCKIIQNPIQSPTVLPDTFISKHYDYRLPDNMVILNVSEYHQWEVRIRKIGPNYCIADGWFKFIEDLRLNPGDILCFQKKDVNHINIIIFNKDGRQVLLNNTPLIEPEYEHISNVEGYRQVSDDPNYPFFAMTVTHQLILPKLITDLTGLNEFSEVKIKVVKGNIWVTNLRTHNIDGQIRYGVVGWKHILQAEHISLGDDCFFNWSKTNSRLLVTKLQQAEVLQQ